MIQGENETFLGNFSTLWVSLARGNDSHLGFYFFERKQSQGIFRPLGHCLFWLLFQIKTRLKTGFECMTVRFMKDIQRLYETLWDILEKDFLSFDTFDKRSTSWRWWSTKDKTSTSWIWWSTMDKTSTSWIWWSTWTKVATRTTRTIFKLVGPCEILSRSKT